MLPVLLNLTGRLVVVVGYGGVGRRRALAAHAAGAGLRIVDPDLARVADRLPPNAISLAEPYRPDHLEGAVLAFACAPPAVNARVVADARRLNILVSSASDPDTADFTLPAVVRRGPLVLAIGTSGAAPALARRLRQRWEAEFDAAYETWLGLLAEARRYCKVRKVAPAVWRRLADEFCDETWLQRVRAEGAEAVRAAMLARIKETT